MDNVNASVIMVWPSSVYFCVIDRPTPELIGEEILARGKSYDIPSYNVRVCPVLTASHHQATNRAVTSLTSYICRKYMVKASMCRPKDQTPTQVIHGAAYLLQSTKGTHKHATHAYLGSPITLTTEYM